MSISHAIQARCRRVPDFRQGPAWGPILRGAREAPEETGTALRVDVEWSTDDGKHYVITRQSFQGDLLNGSRVAVQQYLADCVERFVAVFRARIEKLLRESA